MVRMECRRDKDGGSDPSQETIEGLYVIQVRIIAPQSAPN